MEEIIEKDMTPILLEDLGMRYPTKDSKQKKRYGLYQCQYCGKKFEVGTPNIQSGNTKSCGCKSSKFSNPHGMRKHRLYNTWKTMKNRCLNEQHKAYKNYGGRGIKVCARWLDINNFIEDMYPSFQEGLTLDRIDVNGDYKPDNCRWTTDEIQHRNTRDIQINNTSGYRGVGYFKRCNKYRARIIVNNKEISIGYYLTALEAAKSYERYVRINNLEHNFTPVLTEEEIEELYKINR